MRWLVPLLLLAGCAPPLDDSDVRATASLREWNCDSPGGYLKAGVDMGQSFHDRGVWTHVMPRATCGSAAAIAWLGGRPRTASGKLIFHGPTPALDLVQGVVLINFLQQWDVPNDIIVRFMALKPGEAWQPSPADMARLQR